MRFFRRRSRPDQRAPEPAADSPVETKLGPTPARSSVSLPVEREDRSPAIRSAEDLAKPEASGALLAPALLEAQADGAPVRLAPSAMETSRDALAPQPDGRGAFDLTLLSASGESEHRHVIPASPAGETEDADPDLVSLSGEIERSLFVPSRLPSEVVEANAAQLPRPGGIRWPRYDESAAPRGRDFGRALPWVRDARAREFRELLQELRSRVVEIDRLERLEAQLARSTADEEADPGDVQLAQLRRSAAAEDALRRRRELEELEGRVMLLSRRYPALADAAE